MTKFNKPLLIRKSIILKSQNDHNLSSKETKYLDLSCQFDLSTMSYGVICSFFI